MRRISYFFTTSELLIILYLPVLVMMRAPSVPLTYFQYFLMSASGVASSLKQRGDPSIKSEPMEERELEENECEGEMRNASSSGSRYLPSKL